MGAVYFSQTLIILWLSKNGFNFSNIVVYYLISYVVAIISIFILSKIKMELKPTILLGVLLSALSVAVLIDIHSSYQLYISAILTGLNVIFFWIPYNMMYFKYSSEKKRGLNSGMYFLITPIVSIILQPFAGLVAEKFGFETVFLIGIFLYVIPIFITRFLPNFEFDLNIKKELVNTGFNWPNLFQGFILRISYSLIPLFTLFFITTPKDFGNFFGYLAILATVASLINAYFSDKMKSRKIFFYIFTIFAVISFLPLAFIDNVHGWIIFTGISSLCIYLANPFWFAFSFDYYKNINVEKTIVLREIFLDLGYVMTLLVIFIVFYFTSSTKISLIVVSLIACIFPVVSCLQGIYKDKNI